MEVKCNVAKCNVAKCTVVQTLVEGPHIYERDEAGNISKNGRLVPPENYRYIPKAIGGTRDDNSVLTVLKRELLNIIEGIGLPEKQETAVKRMVTDTLHKHVK